MTKLLISDHPQLILQVGILNGSQRIGSQKSRDPSLMLRSGLPSGLVYVGFLATWFWATRFRMRPPRDAHH
jgi:hypothetical protein